MAKSTTLSLPGRFLVFGLIVFELVILFLIGYTWYAIGSEPTSPEVKSNINIISVLGKVALTVILSWLGILMSYYGWIIYFYNYNFGRSEEFWNKFTARAAECNQKGIKSENELYEEMGAPRSNPYADETFGVPPGTVRGTLTLSILVGATALTIIFFGEDHRQVLQANSLLHNYFDFFQDAFLMVVAFYFGTKGLDIIQRERTARMGARNQDIGVSEEEAGLQPTSQETNEKPSKSLSSSLISKPALKTAPSVVKTKVQILETNYPHIKDLESNRRLTTEDKEKFADDYKLDPATIEAVIKVESRGNGFLTDGRPIILFEGHVFWKQLKQFDIDSEKYAPDFPHILYPHWTKEFYKPGTGEYSRLNEAQKIQREAALCSASWGLFQVMGYHYKNLKYKSIDDFVDQQFESEYQHLEAFGRYIQHNNLIKALQEKDWEKFAKGYNGPAYAKNNYHLKLKEFYTRFSEKDKVIA